jgi:hypothetical protein
MRLSFRRAMHQPEGRSQGLWSGRLDEVMGMTRILTVLTCALLLAGCSPQFDWRPVAFGRQGAAGVLPDKPQTQTRKIRFESHDLPLTMHSARAGSVLFALGEAPLEAKLANDPAARERLASWAVAAIYHNAGVEPPAMLPDPGTRFTVDGRSPKGPLRFEAQVRVTASEWLEAIVIGAPADFARAPVDDFWLSLRWSTAPQTTGHPVSPP